MDSGDDMDALPQPRDDYTTGVLDEGSVPDDPIELLRHWLDAAVAAEVPEPTAATLATVDRDGRPDARVVLLRGSDERGVWWFTNRRSAKGEQLRANPVGAVVAYWPLLERQVRLRGPVEDLPDEESDAYFASRPLASRIGAWASEQSAPIADRTALEARVAEVEHRFPDGPRTRPPDWGGQLLRPGQVEFWQGRPARLHDRLRYVRSPRGWDLQRLQP